MGTHIGSDGFPREMLLSAAAIFDSTAKGAAEHFTVNVSSLVDTCQIAFISTDDAATCTVSHKGMFMQLKENDMYSEKLLFLPDLCHRIERLFGNNTPTWFAEVIDKTDRIIAKMNTSQHLRNAVISYGNQAGLKYFAMQTTCQTRLVAMVNSIQLKRNQR